METLSMSATERRRLTVFSQVQQQVISVAQAAGQLGISPRQARRLWKRFRLHGDRGLIHGLRGHKSNAAKGELREKVLWACRGKYRGFSSAHARDFLAKD